MSNPPVGASRPHHQWDVWDSPSARSGGRHLSARQFGAAVGGFLVLAAVVVVDHADHETNGGVRVDPGWALASTLGGSSR